MSRLLHVLCSPRKGRSVSRSVARAFLDAYASKNPGDDVETLDLWSVSLPEFDGDVLEAKYAVLHGKDHTSQQAAAWKAVVDAFDRFNRADKFVFSVPMWNFGIPYKLKHLIDVITQPGLAFRFSPESGYTGLVTGRPALVILARGGEYPPESDSAALDLQKPYLETWLRFIGVTDVQTLVVEPTLDPRRSEDRVNDALERARTVAAGF